MPQPDIFSTEEMVAAVSSVLPDYISSSAILSPSQPDLLSSCEIDEAAIAKPGHAFFHQAGVALYMGGQESADGKVGHRQRSSQGLQAAGARPHVHVYQAALAPQHAAHPGFAALAKKDIKT